MLGRARRDPMRSRLDGERNTETPRTELDSIAADGRIGGRPTGEANREPWDADVYPRELLGRVLDARVVHCPREIDRLLPILTSGSKLPLSDSFKSTK